MPGAAEWGVRSRQRAACEQRQGDRKAGELNRTGTSHTQSKMGNGRGTRKEGRRQERRAAPQCQAKESALSTLGMESQQIFLEVRSGFISTDLVAIFKPTLMGDGKEKDH